MSNPYFTASGVPANQARGISASVRSEFSAVGVGFDDVYAEIQALAAAIGVPTSVTEVPVASGATTDIGNGYGPVISITGTTTITSFGTNYNGAKFIRFTGILTLTNSASLVLPGGANITTVAGDACIAIPIGNPASGWRVLSYCRMSKPMLDDDAIRASVSYSNPSWITSLAWSKISGTPTTRAGYGIVDAAGNGNNSDITSLSGLSGNITFTGTGNRITGDFTNATIASRVMFQTSTVNGATAVFAIPNGTSTNCNFTAVNSSDPNNASTLQLSALATETRLASNITGIGTYLPLTIYTSGSLKLSIAADTTGTYNFGGTAPRITGDFSNSTVANRVMFQTSTVNGDTRVRAIPNGTSTNSALQSSNSSDPDNCSIIQIVAGATEVAVRSDAAGTGTYLPLTIYTGGSERFQAGTAGQWGIAGANYGTVGQTIFSGGPSAAPSWSSLPRVGGAFTAYRSTSQTSGTTVIFDTATSSISCYNTSTGLFTAQATGWYQLNMSIQIENVSGAAVGRVISLVANGVTVATAQQSTSEIPNNTTKSFNASASVYLTSGQTAYVSASAVFSSNVRALGSTGCSFSGGYLGA